MASIGKGNWKGLSQTYQRETLTPWKLDFSVLFCNFLKPKEAKPVLDAKILATYMDLVTSWEDKYAGS